MYDDLLVQMLPQDEPIEDLHFITKEGIASDPEALDKYRKKIIYNVKLIRDTMTQLRPDSLVLEMCDDRYDRWLNDVVSHPNYDNTMQNIHNILDKKPEMLLEYEDISVDDSSLEYLIGFDFCSYRIPCKTIMGDRSYKLTRKRFESKKAMLNVYKEAAELAEQRKNQPAKKEPEN